MGEVAKNNVLGREEEVLAFSVWRSKKQAIILYTVDDKVEEETLVSITEADSIWADALTNGYRILF